MDIAEITLIVPPYERNIGCANSSVSLNVDVRKYPSLGLGYIAAVLENAGYTVRYIDMYAEELKLKELLSQLRKSPPSIVGVTADLVTYYTAKKIAASIIQKFSEAYLIMGGPHTTIYPKALLENSPFNAIVRGEGEETIVELIAALERSQPLNSVKGISYKKNGTIYVNKDRPLIQNLDEIPFPARHLMPMEKYYSVLAKKRKFTTIIASRGCPFRCSYCLEQGPLRLRSPQNVVDEIEFVVEKYGISEFFFNDSTFSANMNHTTEFCNELLNRRLDIEWECRTRVDRVSKKLLKLMKRAGCQRIHYGIESGDPKMLKVLNKNITLKQAVNAVQWTKDINIEILIYFMFGAPGETLKSINNSIQLANKMDPDFAIFSIISLGPGQPLYENALKEGIFKEDYWKEYISGKLQCFPRLTFESEELSRKKLVNLLKKAYFQFYFRPRIILRRLRKIQSVQELINNIKGLSYMLKSFLEEI